jgi:hypothetical protein
MELKCDIHRKIFKVNGGQKRIKGDVRLSLNLCNIDYLQNLINNYRVPIPFKVDRLNLRSDDRWSRIVAQTNEQRIIWADNAMKINRKDAKASG